MCPTPSIAVTLLGRPWSRPVPAPAADSRCAGSCGSATACSRSSSTPANRSDSARAVEPLTPVRTRRRGGRTARCLSGPACWTPTRSPPSIVYTYSAHCGVRVSARAADERRVAAMAVARPTLPPSRGRGGRHTFGERFKAVWPAYQAWFLQDGDAARPSYARTGGAARHTCRSWCPRGADVPAGGRRRHGVARAGARPRPPHLAGCTQAGTCGAAPRSSCATTTTTCASSTRCIL